MKRLLCWLGLHDWTEYGPGGLMQDPFPVSIRMCGRCGKRQSRGWGNRGPWEDAIW